jgi:hypothetical protein
MSQDKQQQKQHLIELMNMDSWIEQTPVDWFFEELKKHKLLVTPYTKGANSLYEKAKQIEERYMKEERLKGFTEGYDEGLYDRDNK